MITIHKVKKIFIDTLSLIILIPLVIVCVILMVLLNGVFYELAIIILIAAIIGGGVLFITTWSMILLTWLAEQINERYLINDSTIDLWAERIGITVGVLVFAFFSFQWLKRVYVAVTTQL
jgi:hypothetical protein